ncbi:hypothetical protein [Nonomuraea pusilla]|uniref:Uncharacterized protein n=1 Tax=Nonomuraea pusilla TaxID=46177 RepID=A0A1H8KAK0_9ACTN|nr:hypothetical protein [Nonomuraea pusilla]SEN89875.1 hypothetical protein SAMN05660976_08561 [Nonomuraea pusilla]
MAESTTATPQTTLPADTPGEIEAAQQRILTAINQADGVGYSTCADCAGPIMRMYSIYGGWVWLAARPQDGLPPAQCPAVDGYSGMTHGPHHPRP